MCLDENNMGWGFFAIAYIGGPILACTLLVVTPYIEKRDTKKAVVSYKDNTNIVFTDIDKGNQFYASSGSLYHMCENDFRLLKFGDTVEYNKQYIDKDNNIACCDCSIRTINGKKPADIRKNIKQQCIKKSIQNSK